jgi:hypothetical protein
MGHRLTGPCTLCSCGTFLADFGTAYDNLLDYDYPGSHLAPTLGSMPLTHTNTRRRRRSSVSFVTRPPVLDQYRLSGSHQIKFKRRGAFGAGITLAEAQSHTRLSNNDHYTLRDLNADGRANILLTARVSIDNVFFLDA